jgi:hypothetical protein
MPVHLRFSAVAVLLLLAGSVYAADWDSFENAQKNSVKLDKPIFLAVMMSVQGYPDNAYGKLTERAANDEDAKAFVTASVNVGQLSMSDANAGGTGYVSNKEKVAKYGRSGSCSVYVPGASRPLWTMDGAFSKEDVFKQAKKAYDAWRTRLDEIETLVKADKELKKDIDTLLELSQVWADGFVAKPALENLDDAVKLIKKADKADARLEELALRRAEIQLDCGMYAEANKGFADFMKDYEASESMPAAKLGYAKAMIGEGNNEGALKQLRLLKADDSARKLHKEIDGLIEKLEKEAKEEK